MNWYLVFRIVKNILRSCQLRILSNYFIVTQCGFVCTFIFCIFLVKLFKQCIVIFRVLLFECRYLIIFVCLEVSAEVKTDIQAFQDSRESYKQFSAFRSRLGNFCILFRKLVSLDLYVSFL